MGVEYDKVVKENEELKRALEEARSENRIGFAGKPLTQLPNGDLWRGVPTATVEVEVIDPAPDMKENGAKPSNEGIEKAMENIRNTATKRGSLKMLTCNWCGHQTEGIGADKNMRYHLEKQHSQALAPSDDKALLMKSLADANAQLAEATSGN